MLDKLAAVANRFEEICARSEQPDFYADPKKAAAILRERNDLEPIVEAYEAYRRAEQDMDDAQDDDITFDELEDIQEEDGIVLTKLFSSSVNTQWGITLQS